MSVGYKPRINHPELSILTTFNPWWQNGVVPKAFVKEFHRSSYYTCRKSLLSDLRRIVVMSGARRTGKTTIMYQLIHDLLEQGVKPQDILFFTFDHPLICTAGMDQVLNIYKDNISDDAHFYMFVDEVQFDKDWTNYLKMAYDMNPDMPSVATGSASAAIEDNVCEGGAGRWTVILAELDKPAPEEESKLMTYGTAARWFQQPVYLLPCDDTGVTQLQIMVQPDYRRRLTRLALKDHYHPPQPDRPCWDALFQGHPFVLAADMELHRVDAAYTLAREQGHSQIVLAALPQQVTEIWGPRYRDTGKARVFTLTKDAITQLLGKTPKPYRPLDTPYVTEKGEMIHAPLIKAVGKAGGYR